MQFDQHHAAGRCFGVTFLLGQSGFVHSRTLTSPVCASMKMSNSFPHCAQWGLPSVDTSAPPFKERSGHNHRISAIEMPSTKGSLGYRFVDTIFETMAPTAAASCSPLPPSSV